MAVNLSPVGGVAAQFFTNTGAVLTGGKLYTYAAGTTTPATTYTSSQGNVAWTNPIVLDAAGRVSGSGEIWLTDGINYKFVLKDSTDVLIATYDNISGINSNFVAYTNSQEIQTATSGQTVFNLTTMQYQVGTNSLSVFVDGVNQYGPGAQYAYTETSSTSVTFVSGLHVGAEVKFTSTQQQGAGAVDSSQVTYDPPYTNSLATNVEAKLAQTVNVKDFGAVGDGSIDDTAAFNAAMLAVANAGGGVVLAMFGKVHYIATTVLIPTNVVLDLQNATLKGTGNSSTANTLVQSAVVTAGVLVANTSANTLTNIAVRNGSFFNAKQAMSLQSCIDACAFENLTINACYNGILANFCLYSKFENIMFRNTTVGYGYTFTNNCNAITLKNVYAAGTNPGTIGTGFVFSANAYAVNMLNCAAEFCSTGILTQELNNFTIDGCYFESVGLAINMENIYRKTGVEIKNCFFSDCAALIEANTTDGFYWSASNQRFSNCSPGTFNVYTDTAYAGSSYLGVCTGTVEYVISSVTPTSVGVPSWMTISDGLDFRGVSNASQSGSGLGTPIYAKSYIRSGANNGVVPFEYGGGTSAVTGTVPFCTVSIPTGASVTAAIQTGITGSGQSMIIFWIYLVDTSGSYDFQGRAYGTTVYMDSALPAGYTCTVTSGGYLLLNIGGVKNAGGTATVTGQIRHI